MADKITILKLVISTLNEIEVKGKDNLDSLLGCINAIESVIQLMEIPTPPEEKHEEGIIDG